MRALAACPHRPGGQPLFSMQCKALLRGCAVSQCASLALERLGSGVASPLTPHDCHRSSVSFKLIASCIPLGQVGWWRVAICLGSRKATQNSKTHQETAEQQHTTADKQQKNNTQQQTSSKHNRNT